MIRHIILASPLFAALAATATGAQDLRRAPIGSLGQLDRTQLSSAQLQQMKTISDEADVAIDRALKANPALRAKLMTELERISQIKLPALRIKAIKQFQAANGEAYRGVLARAGVNMGTLAQRLGAVSPGLNFRVENGTHLVSIASNDVPPLPPPPPQPTTRTMSLGNSDFSFDGRRDCGAVAGSLANYTRPMKILAESWAAVVGGCENSAQIKHQIALANGEVATVELVGNLTVEGFATGLVGSSSSNNSASIRVGAQSVYIECYAFAPIAWVGSCEERKDNVRITAIVERAALSEVIASARSRSTAVVAPVTNGKATAEIVSARVTFRK